MTNISLQKAVDRPAGRAAFSGTARPDPLVWAADYQTVQRFLRGQPDALEELYRQAYPIAVRAVKRQRVFCLLCEADVPDIVHEAFRRCLQKADSFRAASRFSTWLCGFVRYVALETARKNGAWESWRQKSFYLCEKSSYSQNPEALLLLKERDSCLWLAFCSLSRVHRLLVSYAVLKWYSYVEICGMTGLCRSRMKKELNAALYVLRKRFIAAYCPEFFG